MENAASDEVLQQLERRSQSQHARVLDMLHDADRPDLAGELEAKFRDIRNGTDGARSTWHSISAAQRRVLEALEPGRWLRYAPDSNSRYDACGPAGAIVNICRIATARNLCARELIACDGGLLNPEAKLVLTERGRFVLAHGRPLPAKPPSDLEKR